jgi:hypothetical protein
MLVPGFPKSDYYGVVFFNFWNLSVYKKVVIIISMLIFAFSLLPPLK